jgi:hemerythrin-like domain-containing protein
MSWNDAHVEPKRTETAVAIRKRSQFPERTLPAFPIIPWHERCFALPRFPTRRFVKRNQFGEKQIMDAFELLKADHKKVAELFDVLETASGKRKLDVFKRIKSELELHTHVEETILYPALEKPEPTHDLTLEAYEEHKVVKTLLAELSAAKSANDQWKAKAKVLRENVEHHVEEEENELFDKASDALSDEEIETLGQRMAAEKARKQGRPAPDASGAKEKSEEAADKPGLISKIADFVGLGSTANQKRAKTAIKKPIKKGEAKGSRKGQKSSSALAIKRPGTKSESISTAKSKTASSKKRSAGSVRKKAAKKRSLRKG